MSLSRLRWSLAGLLALIGLVAAASALRTYAQHGLVLGIAAVVALAVITVTGMASLGMARKRIHRELLGLDAQIPTGDLYEERRKRLEAIKASGARPDLHALAEASAAKEASRAYLGRYLVATTVLVGLVGTFAGLMETLAKVAPLLADDVGGKSLSLLAAPLAGLHVTFGASLVAIVVTLALSLAQGDLVLHEERALATLEDLTHHQLLPSLWPPDGDANERTVRVLEGLHTQIAHAISSSLSQGTLALQAQLRDMTEGVSLALAEATRKQVTHVTEAVTQVSASLTKSADNAAAALATRLEASAAVATKHAEDSALASAVAAEQMSQQLQKVVASVNEAAKASVEQTAHALASSAKSLSDTLAPLFSAESQERHRLAEALAENITGLHTLIERADDVSTQLTAQAQHTSKALSETGQHVVDAMSATSKTQSELLAQSLTAVGSEVSKQLVQTNESVLSALTENLQKTQALLEQSALGVSESMRSLSTRTETALGETNRVLAASAATMVTNAGTSLVEASHSVIETMGTMAARTESLFSGLGQQQAAAADAAVRGHAQLLAETAATVVAGLGDTMLRSGERLDSAATKLGEATRTMHATLEPLQPRLDALAHEMERLTHEVAVMAAHADSAHGSAVVMAELERMGDGMERLASLVRLARDPQTHEVQEAHS